MNYETAKAEIIAYLKRQDDDYFTRRKTTKDTVLCNDELIDSLATEHLHCVMSFGNEPEWSCRDACDNYPGIRPEKDVFHIHCRSVDEAVDKIKKLYIDSDVCLGEFLCDVYIHNLSVLDIVVVYAKLYQEIEGDEICRIDEDGLRYTIGS